MDLLNFFLGLAAGIATNLFSWWLLFHGIVPKVRFSQHIGKTAYADTGHDKSAYRYRVKFENYGRRAIIDLEVMARLRIKGLDLKNKELWHTFLIPLSPDGNIYYRIPRLMPIGTADRMKSKIRLHAARPINRLYINSAVEHLDRPPYPKDIRKKAKQGILLLEDLLTLGSDATIEVEAFGYDEFSGTRKLFISKLYTIEDVIYGNFEKDGLGIISSSEIQQQKKKQ